MTDYIRSPVFQIKCVELLLTLVAILSFLGSIEPSTVIFLNQLVHFSLYGWLLLDLLIIGGFFIREPVSKFLILVVSLSGTLFSFVASVVLFVGWSQMASGRLIVAAISTLINTLCYAGDSYYIIRFAAD